MQGKCLVFVPPTGYIRLEERTGLPMQQEQRCSRHHEGIVFVCKKDGQDKNFALSPGRPAIIPQLSQADVIRVTEGFFL